VLPKNNKAKEVFSTIKWLINLRETPKIKQKNARIIWLIKGENLHINPSKHNNSF
jgi:hypothetical protein